MVLVHCLSRRFGGCSGHDAARRPSLPLCGMYVHGLPAMILVVGGRGGGQLAAEIGRTGLVHRGCCRCAEPVTGDF